MQIPCQQQDSFKIRDGVPGHGLQNVQGQTRHGDKRWVDLACGCALPVSYLPTHEREHLDA